MRSRVLAGAVALAVVAAALSPAPAGARPGGDPLDAVNTFIGTQDEGNTFPGASAPFGMTQVVPR
jgi:putative alpha-1,2-mannosidase